MESESEYNPDYDFKVDLEKGVKGEEAAKAFVYGSKHEVKVDFRVIDTGNLYMEIEQYSDLFQTDRRPSGLSTTEADFWHVVGPGLVGGIWITTKALRELIAENNFRQAHQPISTDSTNASIGVLVPIKAFLQKIGFAK